MAEFTHRIRLSKAEVDQAILMFALTKKPSGLGIDVHTFHNDALVTVVADLQTGTISGAEISWKDE